jgi:hypothetical protein
MRKKVKYVIIFLVVTLFFLTFIPVKKIDTPKNYWDSQDYTLISSELDSLFKIYSENVFLGDSSTTNEVIINVHENEYYTSIFGVVRSGHRARKTLTVGYLKESDCLELFPDNPNKVLILKDNYLKLISFLRTKF